MPDCVDAALIFHVPTDQVQAHLPEGFVAEPAARTYERFLRGDGPVGPATAVLDRVAVLVVPHYCPALGDEQERMDETWVWLPVEPPRLVPELSPSRVDVYELSHAGQGRNVLSLKQAVGWHTFGDHVAPSDLQRASDGLRLEGTTHDRGSTVLSYRVGGAQDLGIVIEGPIRVWHRPVHALAYLDLVITTGPVPAAFGDELACTLAPGTPAADLLGVTTCAEAIAAGLAPAGAINPPHDVVATFHHLPDALDGEPDRKRERA